MLTFERKWMLHRVPVPLHLQRFRKLSFPDFSSGLKRDSIIPADQS